MKGRNRFVSASGQTQDERIVRMDFNKAKIKGNVRYGERFLFYQGMPKWIYVDYHEIVWAYRRLEDVQSRLCSGTTEPEIHSLMVVTKNGKRLGMPVGEQEYAREGLSVIRQHNSLVDIGFSKEKEEKYL